MACSQTVPQGSEMCQPRRVLNASHPRLRSGSRRRRRRQSRDVDSAVHPHFRHYDTVVTSGGVIGKVTKVLDEASNEIEVQIAEGVKIRVVRSMVQDVRVKAEPVAAND